MFKRVSNILVIFFAILMFIAVCVSIAHGEDAAWTDIFIGFNLSVFLVFAFSIVNIIILKKIFGILSAVFAIIAGSLGFWGNTIDGSSVFAALIADNYTVSTWIDWTLLIGIPGLFVGGILKLITINSKKLMY